jgi:hypothetical protein
MSQRLSLIVSNLLRHVPDPPKPIARPTASFAALKSGQRLCKDETEWLVAETDSQGATIVCLVGGGSYIIGDVQRLEDRNWRASWSRVRAPRKRKEAAK